jgi:glycerol-3-phosphate dehydrogenase
MNEFSWRTRQANLKRMAEEQFDVLIIGGGITGAGTALDAAARGLKTALIEKRDFAAGTSSRSTKLIHGGLRYLEHFDFALVREALRERAILHRLAPHLVEPYPFIVPIYQQSNRNYDHPLKMRAGMFLYDLLAGRHNFARHRRLSVKEALEFAPQLDPQGLRGALLYYDAQTDDARLVVEIIKAAHNHGACIANYAKLERFTHDARGQINGAQVSDGLTGANFNLQARQCINATGVWTDELRELTTDQSNNQGGNGKRVRPSKGVHLTISAERLKVHSAWLIPALTGHRFYFVVPWQGRVNIGTTDTDYDENKDAPGVVNEEVTEILAAINAYFPAAQLEPADVITAWAGLRPLISDGANKSTAAVSREEEIFESRDGLLSIAGGKLTTYRLMAERIVDRAITRLRQDHSLQLSPSSTENIPLGGSALTHDELVELSGRLAAQENISRAAAQHLVSSYGAEATRIAELMRADEALRAPLFPNDEALPHIAAEIVYAARYEMAQTLADALTRRTRLAMLAEMKTDDVLIRCADLMATELGWNVTERIRQIEWVRDELAREYTVTS